MWHILLGVFLIIVVFVLLKKNDGNASHRSGETHTGNAHARAPSFYTIRDNYRSIEEVQLTLRENGLECCELIIGVDFTKSNTWTGKQSFGGRCLHYIHAGVRNPYQSVLNVISRTLSAFDDDQRIPSYGFGDRSTGEHSIFSFLPNNVPCLGLEQVEACYTNIAQHVDLYGPTSFAALIYKAVEIVKEKHLSFHVLCIIADGQVTNEKKTAEAIKLASFYPMSIVMIGVGDGPWDTMEEFDDRLPIRKFDNFQFVNFNDVMTKARAAGANTDCAFALHALMEVPEQFKLIRRLGLFDEQVAGRQSPPTVQVLPPPVQTDVQPPASLPTAPALPQAVSQPAAMPQDFFCAITQEVMTDPVVASDGYTYERAAIERWFARGGPPKSPMTNQPLSSRTLIPNHNLKSQILSWSS